MDRAGHAKGAAHWCFTVLCTAYLAAIVWTSLAHGAEYKATRNSNAAPVALPRATFASDKHLDVKGYVQKAASATGVNPSVAEWIVSHESSHRPQATGDGGESRGLWQINRIYHPEVSDQCAYDVRCSTDWSLQRIRHGNINEWSTWKYRRRWLPDSPQ